MPDNYTKHPEREKTYADICKLECDLCAKGLARYQVEGASAYHNNGWTYAGGCTAPDKDEVIERLAREVLDLRERMEVAELELTGANERCQIILNAKNDWMARAVKAEADTKRLDWLINELNELNSNCTRDVFGLASDEEGDISREFIDQNLATPLPHCAPVDKETCAEERLPSKERGR